MFLAGAVLVQAQNAPSISAVVNSATFKANVAYGSILTLFGANIAAAPVQNSSIPAAFNLSGVEVLFCQTKVATTCKNARLFFADQDQVNFLAPDPPENFSGNYKGYLRVRVNGKDDAAWSSGNPFPVVLDNAPDPGIFRVGFDCPYPQICSLAAADSKRTVERGSIVDLAGAVVSSSNPMRAGSTYSLFLTGFNWPNEGKYGTNGIVYFNLVNPATGYGDCLCSGSYQGNAPGFMGLYQVNFSIPPDLLRIFGDGYHTPKCSQFPDTIQTELKLVGYAPSTGGAQDSINLPVLIHPGELVDCLK
jgi:uncharacterized protein (TIGR03437 family)